MVDPLPIYEPEFKRGHTYRMTVLRVFDDPRPRGGLAIVWGEQNALGKEVLLSRRPAVIELPDMWMTGVLDLWKDEDEDDYYPPEEFDQTWRFTNEHSHWDQETDVVAWGGSWLPRKKNILVEMAKHKGVEYRALAADTQSRCFELCGEHDMVVPAWLKAIPNYCATCGGSGVTGFISSMRCSDCGGATWLTSPTSLRGLGRRWCLRYPIYWGSIGSASRRIP